MPFIGHRKLNMTYNESCKGEKGGKLPLSFFLKHITVILFLFLLFINLNHKIKMSKKNIYQ